MAWSFSDVSDFTREARTTFAGANQLPVSTPLLDTLLARGCITVQPVTHDRVVMLGMSAIGAAKEFNQGESHYTAVSSFTKTLKPRAWDQGVTITRFDFDDMGNHPSGRAMYLSTIADLALVLKRKKEDLLIDLIKAQGDYDSADSQKNQAAYDAAAFFSSSRASGSNVTDTSSATWDHKTLRGQFNDLLAALSTQKAYKSDLKQRSAPPMNGYIVLCNPARYRVLTEVFGAALIGSPGTGTDADGIPAISNMLKDRFGVEVIMHSGIANTEYYVFDASNMIPGVGAIIAGERQGVTLEMNSPVSDSYMDGFELKAHAFMRFDFTWGNWNKCYKFHSLSSS